MDVINRKKWTPWSLKHGDNDLFKYLDQLDKWKMEKWYPIIIHDENLNIPSSYFPYDFWIVPSHCSGKMYPSGWGSCWSSPGHWKGMIAEVISRVVSIVVQWCFNLIHVRSWAGLLYTLFQCVEAIFRCFQPFQVSKTRVFNVVQATPCHASDPFGHCLFSAVVAVMRKINENHVCFSWGCRIHQVKHGFRLPTSHLFR